MMISDVVEAVTFEIETWLKLRDRDFIKNPETETQDFNICALCWIKKNVAITSTSNFFKFLAFFWQVLVVSYLKIQQTNVVEL